MRELIVVSLLLQTDDDDATVSGDGSVTRARHGGRGFPRPLPFRFRGSSIMGAAASRDPPRALVEACATLDAS